MDIRKTKLVSSEFSQNNLNVFNRIVNYFDININGQYFKDFGLPLGVEIINNKINTMNLHISDNFINIINNTNCDLLDNPPFS